MPKGVYKRTPETLAKMGVANWKHGYSRSPTYISHKCMLQRCRSPNPKDYRNYKGRGITFCIGLEEFVGFLAVMGKKPTGLTLDRIDNDGNYSCGVCEECISKGWTRNVRWATWRQQAQSRRPLKGYKQTPEHRAKISAARKRFLINPLERAKISARMAGKRNSLGYKHTDEARARMSSTKMSNQNGRRHG